MLYDGASIRYRLGPDIATMAAAAACGPPTDSHAGLSVPIFIWLRLYRLLLHINEKVITDFLVLRVTRASAAWLAGPAVHAVQPRHALRSHWALRLAQKCQGRVVPVGLVRKQRQNPKMTDLSKKHGETRCFWLHTWS